MRDFVIHTETQIKCQNQFFYINVDIFHGPGIEKKKRYKKNIVIKSK